MKPRSQTLLLWNMGFNTKNLSPGVKRSRRKILEALAAEHKPSIIALQEAAPDLERTTGLGRKYEIIVGRKGITTAFLKARWDVLDHWGTDSHRARVMRVDSTTRQSRLWVYNVHIGAHYNQPHRRRAFVVGELLDELRDNRSYDPDRFELIIGDFNLHPYDDAIMQEGQLWANRSRPSVRSEGHSRSERDHRWRLINVTWVLFGRAKPPYGTFHKHGLEGGPWLVQDQALMSPDLAIPDKQQVEIIERVQAAGGTGKTDLCSKGLRIPKKDVGSDHLPIRVKFQAA